MRAFSKDDPVRLLADNLEWWLPHVTAVIQDELGSFPVVPGEGELPTQVTLEDGSTLLGGVPGWPRKGGDLWRGEAEAAEFVTAIVEEADASGKLRGILDAVRSNRVEDDFSDFWSNARIDFERKLHRTRNKVSVRFVELPDNIPVQGPETEVVDRLVMSDFVALLNEKDRQIVVLLSSGYTRLHDIAAELGYATHSPISKKLAARFASKRRRSSTSSSDRPEIPPPAKANTDFRSQVGVMVRAVDQDQTQADRGGDGDLAALRRQLRDTRAERMRLQRALASRVSVEAAIWSTERDIDTRSSSRVEDARSVVEQLTSELLGLWGELDWHRMGDRSP